MPVQNNAAGELIRLRTRLNDAYFRTFGAMEPTYADVSRSIFVFDVVMLYSGGIDALRKLHQQVGFKEPFIEKYDDLHADTDSVSTADSRERARIFKDRRTGRPFAALPPTQPLGPSVRDLPAELRRRLQPFRHVGLEGEQFCNVVMGDFSSRIRRFSSVPGRVLMRAENVANAIDKRIQRYDKLAAMSKEFTATNATDLEREQVVTTYIASLATTERNIDHGDGGMSTR